LIASSSGCTACIGEKSCHLRKVQFYQIEATVTTGPQIWARTLSIHNRPNLKNNSAKLKNYRYYAQNCILEVEVKELRL